MKKKTAITTLLILALVTSLLVGCGSTTKDTVAAYGSADNSHVESAEISDELGVSTAGGTATETLADQKLVKRAYINAETEDLDALLEALNRQISDLEGYVEYQDVYNGSTYSNHKYRNAELTIRIPANNLNKFITQVEGASNVVSISQSQEDVTLTYVATESRVKALETEQERLLELMEQAETMSDLLEIEARLTEVRSELEQVTTQLRVLSSKVDYATIELSIEQVTVYTQVDEQSFMQRVRNGFQNNLSGIGEDTEDFAVWLLTYSPQLLAYAVVILAIFLIVKRHVKKRKNRQTPPDQSAPQE